jgi:ribosomal protein S18 acetylase RimI-like enzyme
MIVYEELREVHLLSVVELCKRLSWPSYSDPMRASRALSAPGSITRIARSGATVVGLAHLLTDGVIQAHLSLIGVHPELRRQGIVQQLVRLAFAASGAQWLDLVAEEGSERFYRSFAHSERVGFRVYPREWSGEPVSTDAF